MPHGLAFEPVATERHPFGAIAAHFGAERDRAKVVPPFHQAAKDEVGQGHGHGHPRRAKGGGAGKFERHLAGQLGRLQQLGGGQRLVARGAGPGVLFGLAGDRANGKEVAVQRPMSGRLGGQRGHQQLAERRCQAGDAHGVCAPTVDGERVARGGRAEQARTGDRFGAVAVVDLRRQRGVVAANQGECFGVVGAPQLGREDGVGLGGQGENKGSEHGLCNAFISIIRIGARWFRAPAGPEACRHSDRGSSPWRVDGADRPARRRRSWRSCRR